MPTIENEVKRIRTKQGAIVSLIKTDQGDQFFRYQPGETGLDSFTYKISQNNQQSVANVKVSVRSADFSVLRANDDLVEAVQGKKSIIKPLDNDIYSITKSIQLDFLTKERRRGLPGLESGKTIQTPLGATVTLVIPETGDPYFLYQSNSAGKDKFDYIIRQGNQSDTGSIFVQVSRADVELSAIDDTVDTSIAHTVDIRALDNDVFVKALPVTVDFHGQDNVGISKNEFGEPIRFIRTPLKAEVTLINPKSGYPYFKYEPGVAGTDSFQYILWQEKKFSIATIGVEVTKPASGTLKAVDDSYKTGLGKTISLNVLDNDSFSRISRVTLSFKAKTNVALVNVLGVDVPTLTTSKGAKVYLYSPKQGLPYFQYNPGESGTDSFIYKISQEGQTTQEAKVSVEVEGGVISVTANDVFKQITKIGNVQIHHLANDLFDPKQEIENSFYNTKVTDIQNVNGETVISATSLKGAPVELHIPKNTREAYFIYKSQLPLLDSFEYRITQKDVSDNARVHINFKDITFPDIPTVPGRIPDIPFPDGPIPSPFPGPDPIGPVIDLGGFDIGGSTGGGGR